MSLNIVKQLEAGRIKLMRHKLTGFYSGIMLLGKSMVGKECPVPTACTDGINEWYNPEFMGSLSPPEQRFVLLHETKHKADKHMFRFADLVEKDSVLANAAMDYAINDEIMCIQDRQLVSMPKSGGLYDPRFHNWSVRMIYRYLETGQPPPNCGGGGPPNPGGQGKSGQLPTGKPKRGPNGVTIGNETFPVGGFDEHKRMRPATPEEVKKLKEQIAKVDKIIRETGMLAGLQGTGMPRELADAIEPDINWREEMSEFMVSHVKGNDEYTYRNFDRRRLPYQLYLPGTYSERMGELVLAGDLSGSIGQKEMQEWFGAAYAAIQSCKPDLVRMLWWDTNVNIEQVFTPDMYDSLLTLLKPMGGGGTRVGCVAEYMKEKNIKPDCLVIFTDGYVESNPTWDIDTPTLWLVTQNESFNPPKGQKVKVHA